MAVGKNVLFLQWGHFTCPGDSTHSCTQYGVKDGKTFKAEQNATAAKEENNVQNVQNRTLEETRRHTDRDKTEKRKHTLSSRAFLWARQIRRWLEIIWGREPSLLDTRRPVGSCQPGKRQSEETKGQVGQQNKSGCGSFSTLITLEEVIDND